MGEGWGILLRDLYDPMSEFQYPAAFLLDPLCATDKYDCQARPSQRVPARAQCCACHPAGCMG